MCPFFTYSFPKIRSFHKIGCQRPVLNCILPTIFSLYWPQRDNPKHLRNLSSPVQLSTQSPLARSHKRNRNELIGAIGLLLDHTLKDPSHTLACLLSGQDYIYTASPVLIGEAMVSLGPTLLETSVMKATSICGLAVQVTNL